MKKTTKKCSFDKCNNKQNQIIGICKYCNNIYCSKHRLIEDHLCLNISDCYNEKYENNNKILLNNKIENKKMDKI